MNTPHPILIAKDLRVGYNQEPDIIKDFSFEIYPDDVVGIIGPNGGGKTTLVKALLGLLVPRSGAVQYYTREGDPLEHLDIGYVPQQAKLDHQFPISVLDVVVSGTLNKRHLKPNKKDRLEAVNTLERLGIAHLYDRPIGALSGGERQRVILARALVSHPQLLIMDEPTTYVDEAFSEQLYCLIPELQKESALVIVSHNRERISTLTTKIIQL